MKIQSTANVDVVTAQLIEREARGLAAETAGASEICEMFAVHETKNPDSISTFWVCMFPESGQWGDGLEKTKIKISITDGHDALVELCCSKKFLDALWRRVESASAAGIARLKSSSHSHEEVH